MSNIDQENTILFLTERRPMCPCHTALEPSPGDRDARDHAEIEYRYQGILSFTPITNVLA